MKNFVVVAALASAVLLAACGDQSASGEPTAAADTVAVAEVAESAPEPTMDPGETACGIDSVNGHTGDALAENPTVHSPLKVTGWYFLDDDVGRADARLRVVPIGTDAAGRVASEVDLAADRDRPDIAKQYGDDALHSGFTAELADLQTGSYSVEVVFDTADGDVVCGRRRKVSIAE